MTKAGFVLPRSLMTIFSLETLYPPSEIWFFTHYTIAKEFRGQYLIHGECPRTLNFQITKTSYCPLLDNRVGTSWKEVNN